MSTATAPVPQHMRALAKAQEIRLRQAEVKRRIRDGEFNIADAFDDPRLGSLAIGDLLGAQSRWGRTRVRRFLTCVEIRETRRLDQLTERQRRLIREAL